MKILVIGSGGREHALVWALARSPQVQALYCAPGNPGIASAASLVQIPADAIDRLLAFVREESIDLTVVGPEQPLALGIVDAFRAAGRPIFGPTRAAAELEWSKAFAKEFMTRHGIPTAGFCAFAAAEKREAAAYAEMCPLPVVVKADGLAAGKGVLICATRGEVREALAEVMERGTFGKAGEKVVIEEFMEGEEASVFAVTDGEAFVTLAAAQDHKRVNDGDTGKNTGGMGAYAPAPRVTDEVMDRVRRAIIIPTLKGMREEARPYTGCLYVGLMLTAAGPRVVEYNCRFGDPETQVVLPLYGGDLAALFMASARGAIGSLPPAAGSHGSAVCVVLASGGYPDAYPTGTTIRGLETAAGRPGSVVFHAGTRREPDGTTVTAGGRVLGVTAFREDRRLELTIAAAYDAVAEISFDGMHYRHDIGKRALIH
jgi:phosphoribosylamine---glycine ligase